MMSSTNAGLTSGLRSNMALMMCADIDSARTLRKIPPRARPIGVRTASTTTTSLELKDIVKFLFSLINRSSFRRLQPFRAYGQLLCTGCLNERICHTEQQTLLSPQYPCNGMHHHGMEGNRYQILSPYQLRLAYLQCPLQYSEQFQYTLGSCSVR